MFIDLSHAFLISLLDYVMWGSSASWNHFMNSYSDSKSIISDRLLPHIYAWTITFTYGVGDLSSECVNWLPVKTTHAIMHFTVLWSQFLSWFYFSPFNKRRLPQSKSQFVACRHVTVRPSLNHVRLGCISIPLENSIACSSIDWWRFQDSRPLTWLHVAWDHWLVQAYFNWSPIWENT